MTDNMEIWNRLGKTDPEHTKKFQRAGGFKGTAIKPIYTEKKMTEVFGPAGLGWGMGEPAFDVVPGSDGQVAVYCRVALWVKDPADKASTTDPWMVWGVGGDMVVVKQSSGLRTDDEAFKKAFTDAVGNAMKHLGMSADVHMGLFDDNKYVESLREEPSASAENAPERLPKAKARDLYERLQKALDDRDSSLGIESWFSNDKVQAAVLTLPVDWEEGFRGTVELKYKTAIAAETIDPVLTKSPQQSLDELAK